MTELNNEYHPQPAQQSAPWPGHGTEKINDPEIRAIVAALDSVQARPVTEHEAVYGELHDALLQALNEEAPTTGEGES